MKQEGFAAFDRNVKRGRRYSAARAYLHPVKHRKNLTIQCRALVTKVVTEGKLQSILQRSIKERIKESTFTEMNGKAYAVRVISIPNAPRCHHCHGSSEPILGQMTLLSDVSENWHNMQRQAFTDVPYIPIGQILPRHAHRRELVDIQPGFSIFWSVRRA